MSRPGPPIHRKQVSVLKTQYELDLGPFVFLLPSVLMALYVRDNQGSPAWLAKIPASMQ